MKTLNEGQAGKKQEEKKTQSTLDGVVYSNPGNPIAGVYKRVYDKDSDTILVQRVDEFNIEEFIQSSKSQTDLALLQKRFIELGEIPSVDPSLGSNDLTVFPSNIHEAYDMVTDVKTNFGKLPESIQKIFGSSEAYMKALLDGSYQATLIAAINKQTEAKEEPKQEGDK